MGEKTKKKGSISYAKWGYIFIAPFFIIFAVFQLIPLVSTIYYSFFEYYRSGLKIIGPSFVGLKNYITLFTTDLPKYFGNTILLWIIGFIPQIAVSLLLAAWFTDLRLKLKGQTFFKTVIYMPNLIMASAFAMLFFALFSGNGPVNALDTALRKALLPFYPRLKEMKLLDFKVRVLSASDGTGGTASVVRVLIESGDADSTWVTVGVSHDIIEASWQGLVDSVVYKLYRDEEGQRKLRDLR